MEQKNKQLEEAMGQASSVKANKWSTVQKEILHHDLDKMDMFCMSSEPTPMQWSIWRKKGWVPVQVWNHIVEETAGVAGAHVSGCDYSFDL